MSHRVFVMKRREQPKPPGKRSAPVIRPSHRHPKPSPSPLPWVPRHPQIFLLHYKKLAQSNILRVDSHQSQILWQTLLVRSIEMTLHEIYAANPAATSRSEHSSATDTSIVMPCCLGDLHLEREPGRDRSPVTCGQWLFRFRGVYWL